MCRTRRKWPVISALVPVLFAGGVHGGDQPPVNQLEGTVVSKADGQPVAGIPVAMAHAAKGYVYVDEQGPLAYAQHETLFGIFPVRNGRYACMTVTDANGHYVLRDIAAPTEPWLILAGDPAHGYAIRRRILPGEFASRALRLELEPSGFIELRRATDAKTPTPYVEIGLSHGPVPPVASVSPELSGEEETEHVAFRSGVSFNEVRGKVRRLGPLPGGQWYKLTAQDMAGNLPYSPVLAERLVKVEPGATAEVTLEVQEGATVNGRVTNTEGKPLGKVNVTVRTADGSVFGTVSDHDGKYELRGVPPGTHTLKLLRHAKRTAPG